MLLSRLKNRNKTAPAPEPPAQPTTEAEHRLRSPVGHDSMRPQVSVDTWVTPSPGTESQVRDPLEGLPELPKFTHALPPLKGQWVYFWSEDLQFQNLHALLLSVCCVFWSVQYQE